MPEKSRPVFLDYDQTTLDAAYNQAAYAPNREQLIQRRIRDSELARRRIGEPERASYGPAEIERLDIYCSGCQPAPVFVFIHGGAWRSGRSQDFAGPAEMFLAAGHSGLWIGQPLLAGHSGSGGARCNQERDFGAFRCTAREA